MESILEPLLTESNEDLVTYEIFVEDNIISAIYNVTTIMVEEGINKIPSAQIVILDGSPSEAKFEVSDASIFMPGKKIEIRLGYNGNNQTIFKGIIIINSHKVKDNCSEIQIDC